MGLFSKSNIPNGDSLGISFEYEPNDFQEVMPRGFVGNFNSNGDDPEDEPWCEGPLLVELVPPTGDLLCW